MDARMRLFVCFPEAETGWAAVGCSEDIDGTVEALETETGRRLRLVAAFLVSNKTAQQLCSRTGEWLTAVPGMLPIENAAGLAGIS